MNSGQALVWPNLHLRINLQHCRGHIFNKGIERLLNGFDVSFVIRMKVFRIVMEFQIHQKLDGIIRETRKHPLVSSCSNRLLPVFQNAFAS